MRRETNKNLKAFRRGDYVCPMYSRPWMDKYSPHVGEMCRITVINRAAGVTNRVCLQSLENPSRRDWFPADDLEKWPENTERAV